MKNQQRQFVLSLLAYAVQREVVPQQLCSLCGIDLHELRELETIRFTQTQWDDLWRHVSSLTNDPLFGLHFGESLQPAALGVVGEIIKTSGTVGEALKQAAALSYLVTDLFTLEVTSTAEHFSVNFHPEKKSDNHLSIAFRQTMEFFMVFVIHELDGLLLEKIKPDRVILPYAVTNQQEYERVLRCRPVQRAETYAITFEKKYWNEPIIIANYELQSILLQKIIPLNKKDNEVPSFGTKIFHYLIANSYLGIMSVNDMAANFNMSSRTLQRKLKEEGIKYQDLADRAKKSLAVHYLRSERYRIKEISFMMGYNELSAFTKAFRRWTGTSPTDYQNNSGSIQQN